MNLNSIIALLSQPYVIGPIIVGVLLVIILIFKNSSSDDNWDDNLRHNRLQSETQKKFNQRIWNKNYIEHLDKKLTEMIDDMWKTKGKTKKTNKEEGTTWNNYLSKIKKWILINQPDYLSEHDKSDFYFSTGQLVKWFVGGSSTNFVYNPDLKWEDVILGRQDFFFKMQTLFNYLVRTEKFPIEDIPLKAIKKEIWSWNIQWLIQVLNRFSVEQNIVDSMGEVVVRKIIILILNSPHYKYASITSQQFMSDKVATMSKLVMKQKEKIQFTSDEEKVADQIDLDIEIKKEVDRLVGKKNIVVIRVDKENRELHLSLDYNDVFSKKIKVLIDHYKDLWILNKIIFYI